MISLFHDDQEDHTIGNGKTLANMTIPTILDDLGDNRTAQFKKIIIKWRSQQS